MNQRSRVFRPGRAAFTMAEMLIVIGIITLLAAILVPTVAGVRRSARRTATQARMAAIAAACQHYYNDFRAYPGPLRNDQLAGSSKQGTPFVLGLNGKSKFMTESGADDTSVPVKEITQSENLTLGLMGGLTVTYRSSGSTTDIDAFSFDAKTVGGGPQSLTAVATNRKTYSPYLSQPDWLFGSASSLASLTIKKGGMEKGDSRKISPCTPIPEFVDADGIPILYLRARPGAPVTTGNVRQAGVSATDDLQYNYKQLLPYAAANDFVKNGAAMGPTQFSEYLKRPDSDANPTPTNPWQPRGKDAFILISAGSDGFYGTDDDLFYPQ